MNYPIPSQLPQRTRDWVAMILRAFLLTLTALSLFGCKPAETSDTTDTAKIVGEQITFPTNSPQLTYLTIEPVKASQTIATSLYGRLAWDDDLTARVYSPVAGRITRIPVEVNQIIANGGALAELDSPDYSQALADARTAEGNFAAADRALERARELLAHGAAAQKDVEAAEAAAIAARAERDRARARLVNYNGILTDSNTVFTLRSPLPGVVVEKNVSPGQEIRPDLMLANAPQFINPQFVVTDPSHLWLFLDVEETAADSLTPGREILIHSKAWPDKVFHGHIEVIGQELDPTTRTVKTRCTVDNPDHSLRAEMYVTAEVATEGTAGVSVPTKTVFLKDNEHFVFVETAPGQFERRRVQLGAEGGGETVVLEGLQSGQRVVTEGCLLLESMLEGSDS